MKNLEDFDSTTTISAFIMKKKLDGFGVMSANTKNFETFRVISAFHIEVTFCWKVLEGQTIGVRGLSKVRALGGVVKPLVTYKFFFLQISELILEIKKKRFFWYQLFFVIMGTRFEK